MGHEGGIELAGIWQDLAPDFRKMGMIPLKKSDLRRCFNFPAHAAYAVGANPDSPSSFLENFAPCISGFLNRIRFRGFCSTIGHVFQNSVESP